MAEKVSLTSKMLILMNWRCESRHPSACNDVFCVLVCSSRMPLILDVVELGHIGILN